MLISVCHSRNWLTRYAASFISRVVMLTLPEPINRMKRSRKSSRCAEHERHQHDDDDRARDRLEHRAARSRAAARPADAVRHDAHRLGTALIGDVVVELLGHAIHGARELPERGVVARAQLGDLAPHGRGVAPDLGRQLRELIEHDVADAADGPERQQHGQRDAGKARQAHAIEHAHQRRQHERQHDAERQRQQHRFAGPEDADDQHERQQRHPGPFTRASGLTAAHDSAPAPSGRYADL